MANQNNNVPERPKIRPRPNPVGGSTPPEGLARDGVSASGPPLPPQEPNPELPPPPLPPMDSSFDPTLPPMEPPSPTEVYPFPESDPVLPPPYQEPPPILRDPIPDDMEDIPYVYDPKTSYFFVFGVKGSGKSVLLSGVLYNIRARRLGDQARNLNDNNVPHERLGTQLLNEMMEQIPSGDWPRSTTTLASEGRTFPRHMHFQFNPKDGKKPDFKFCMMDMSGEDLERVRVSEWDAGRLNPGIDVFLELPVENLSFVCVYPSLHDRYSHAQLSTYMVNFLDKLEAKGKATAPILMVVSQWDRVSDNYPSPEAFLEENAPLVWNRLHAGDRDFSLMEFSIGHVNEQTNRYKYSPAASNRLFEWMYSSRMEVSLNEPVKQSVWDRLLDKVGRK